MCGYAVFSPQIMDYNDKLEIYKAKLDEVCLPPL